MKKPEKIRQQIKLSWEEERKLSSTLIKMIEDTFGRHSSNKYITPENLELIAIAIQDLGLSSISQNIDFYNEDIELNYFKYEDIEETNKRFEKDIEKYKIWLSQEESRLLADAKALGYKLVKI